jgi:branched-chain amino acid transport system substrate-binding protein
MAGVSVTQKPPEAFKGRSITRALRRAWPGPLAGPLPPKKETSVSGSRSAAPKAWYRPHGLRALLALSASLTVLLVACGNDDDSSSSGGATKGEKATGSPIKVGLVNPESGEHAFPEFRDAGVATAKYLNQAGGGIDGHRVDLRTCRSDGTPQGAIKCANEMVDAGVVAVIAGEDRSVDSAFPIYQKAGIPFISASVVTNQQFINPVAVSLSPGIPGSMAGIAKFIRDELEGKTTVVILEQVIPEQIRSAFIDVPLTAAGIKNGYSLYAPQTPDVTPAIVAAVKKDPDVLIPHFDNDQQCVSAMRAMDQQLDDSQHVVQTTCSDDQVLEAAGAAAEGQYFLAFEDVALGADTPQTQLFEKIMEEYSDSKDTGLDAAEATEDLMTLKAVLEDGAAAKITPERILKAFKQAKGQSIFMGAPLECGASVAYPSLCSLSIRIFTYKDGKKTPVTGWYSGAAYLPKTAVGGGH